MLPETLIYQINRLYKSSPDAIKTLHEQTPSPSKPLWENISILYSKYPVPFIGSTDKYTTNFGISCAALLGVSENINSKFLSLVRTEDQDTIWTLLLEIIDQLRTQHKLLGEDIGNSNYMVDWYQLCADLGALGRSDRSVQLRWQSSFYSRRGASLDRYV